MPLYHYVTADLPSSTMAPELDDTNATTVLHADAKHGGSNTADGASVTPELVGIYLAYLVAVGFLPGPGRGSNKALPKVVLADEQRQALAQVGGRGGLV